MSHIRVDDDMHRRVMDAVSKAISENASGNGAEGQMNKSESAVSVAEISPLNSNDKAPVRRRRKAPLITVLSIAATLILVAGGAVFFVSRFRMGSKTQNSVAGGTMEFALDGNKSGKRFLYAVKSGKGSNSEDRSSDNTVAAAEDDGETTRAEATEALEESTKSSGETVASPGYDEPDIDFTNIRESMPYKNKTAGRKAFDNGQVAWMIFDAENGETMIIFASRQVTDIEKAYYPEFSGIPATHHTEGGIEFKGIDASVGKNVKVSETGPYDGVTWTKDGIYYLMVFSSKRDAKVFAELIDKI